MVSARKVSNSIKCSNCIKCKKCKKKIHKKCSGIKGKLKPDPKFQCKSCVSEIQNEQKEIDKGENGKLE